MPDASQASPAERHEQTARPDAAGETVVTPVDGVLSEATIAMSPPFDPGGSASIEVHPPPGVDSHLTIAEHCGPEGAASARHHDAGATQAIALPGLAQSTPPDSTLRQRVADIERGGLGMFGDYELLSEIARGGMGVVYKARQWKLNRLVALKMILSGRFAGEEDVRRLYTEAEAAAQLDHPHIVPIYEVGELDGQHFFSMAFVDGQSLAARVGDGPLEPREAARLTVLVADAVDYAHAHGVIHRDLKPANILLDEQGSPKVTDFGLAKLTEGESGLTASGQIMGTPSYMPPEQARGHLDEVDATSDVYSLGAVLYFLLAGRPPFQAASVVDTLRQVTDREPVSPRQLNPQVEPDLDTICLKCLEKDRERRYGSANELADDLRRYLEGRPVLARPVGRLERGWRSCRRNPLVAGLLTAVAVSLVAGTIVSTSFALAELERAREAEHNLELARRNFRRARDAVDKFFTRVSEETLLNQPGMQPLQHELLREALEYYRLFLREQGDDALLRDDLAMSHFRVAAITEAVESPAAALPAYRRALAMQQQLLQEHPGDSNRLRTAGNTLSKYARALYRTHQIDEALQRFNEALAARKRQASANPDDPQSHRLLANAWMNLGIVEWNQGRRERGEELLTRAQEIRREQLARADDADLRRDLAMGAYNLGDLQFDHADISVPARQFEIAARTFEELIAAGSDEIDDRYKLALCCRSLGDLALDEAKAEHWYAQARDMLSTLTRRNPNVPDYQRGLAGLYMNLGLLLHETGRQHEALASYAAALTILETLSEDFPETAAYRRELAVTLRAVAEAESGDGLREAARRKLERSTSILSDLVREYPDEQDFASELAATKQALAEL